MASAGWKGHEGYESNKFWTSWRDSGGQRRTGTEEGSSPRPNEAGLTEVLKKSSKTENDVEAAPRVTSGMI